MRRRSFMEAALAAGSLALPGLARAGQVAAAAVAPDSIEPLIDYLVRTRFQDLPAPALAMTRAQLLDTMGIALAGRGEAGVRELRELARELGGKGESVVWGSPLRVPAHDAARINAVMVHALEFDDTFGRGYLHPAAITYPAALAVADLVGGVDGRELLTAVTLATDIACRIAISSQPGVDGFATGWHNTTLIGYLAAAMLAGRLMKLPPARIVDAVGIAYHQAAGNAQSHIDSALTKRLGPGMACAAGVFAARLAMRGVTGPRGVLDGKKGWYAQYHRGLASHELLLGDLGERFPAEELSFKPWPSCRGSHTSADAALQIVAEHRVRPDQIERVVIRNGPAEWPFLSNPIERKRRPATVVEAQFSIPWVVAAALVDGKVRIAQFTQDALQRADILAMTARTSAVQDDRLANPRGGPGQAVVEVATRDGRVLTKHVVAAKGDPQAPMSPAEIEAKFADCMDYAGLPNAQATALRQLIAGIDRVTDVRSLSAAMAMSA
ncbi:MmgE/PrpD family protein [Sphingomonas turrisvirgatae]|nr:MmgE/PrpD family protein [Sphingomonas turrisvirgatae]